jgi:hypothetical protein
MTTMERILTNQQARHLWIQDEAAKRSLPTIAGKGKGNGASG